jgi:plastocyanin
MVRDERCVFIEPTTFLPDSVIVSAGARVTWVNADRRAHRVVSTDGRFRSPFLEAGESYSLEFNEPGVYSYYCRCNPCLGGAIVVEGRAATLRGARKSR